MRIPATTPTTPPRPFDVTEVFPQLVPLARTATRLHPRPGSPTPQLRHLLATGGVPLSLWSSWWGGGSGRLER
ncbi:hypothetical protein ABZ629_19350, partial [Streptomyces sp. NPDC007110]